MRIVFADGLNVLRRIVAVTGLAAVTATGASAQLLFDGNLFFNNNASGTLAGQFTGAPTGGTCPGGTSAANLGTITYPNNLYADPLLPNAPYQANTVPSFQPGLGSPAYGSAVRLPSDGFFEQVCYRGAIGPQLGDDWTQGWTYWDSTGASRQDLHLPGMPNPRPLATYAHINLVGKAYFGPDSNYLVRGQLRVKSQGSLTIAPGVVIFEEKATTGTIIVERGGQLWAVGNACEPIIITSDQAPGLQRRGDIGGLAILGRAKTNVVNSCAGDSAASEGGAVGFYGGNDDNDNSGALRYVRVEYAGKEITTNNELNSFTWNACGLATRGDYLQAFRGADDGFEWFGGTMNQKYLLAVDGTDDGYDTQLGTRNKAQFVIVRVSPELAPAGTQNGERGIEADNNEFNNNQTQCAGRSLSRIANATLVGDKRAGASFPGSTQGAQLRRGTGFHVSNSIVFNFKTAGIAVSDNATWDAHCAAPPPAPALHCPGSVGAEPTIGSGAVFAARSMPNPFRHQVAFSFTLREAAPVTLEIYSADGRRVDTIEKGELAAGRHTVAWTLGRNHSSGMYFYKVVAGPHAATGKLTHLE